MSNYYGFEDPGLISRNLFNWVGRLMDEARWASLADPPDHVSLGGQIDEKIGRFVLRVARLIYWVEMKHRAIRSVLQ